MVMTHSMCHKDLAQSKPSFAHGFLKISAHLESQQIKNRLREPVWYKAPRGMQEHRLRRRRLMPINPLAASQTQRCHTFMLYMQITSPLSALGAFLSCSLTEV